MRALLAAVLFVAACGVRAPAPVDVAALVAKRGPVEARRDLAMRVVAHPRDVQARLALAALADQLGRPSEAIEQLDAVEKLGGPIGVRWHDEDRARLGRLVLARGRARLARGAPTALADLERAGKLGVRASEAELTSARVVFAQGLLRHIDPDLRAKGRALLSVQAKTARVGADEAAWAGAKDDAGPAEHGAFGAWLWTIGARREAYEQLARWHDATKPPRDEALQGAYLRALAWWKPSWLGEVPPPPAEDLVGPERCWFPGTECTPPRAEEEPLPPVAPAAPGTSPYATAVARYAASHAVLGSDGQGIASAAPDASSVGMSRVTLADVAAAYARDPAIAERVARDFVAISIDGAAAQASLGALFDALGDPGRARAAWSAAVDGSPEPSFQRGLAEAMARGGDAPAALVMGTASAAASGDPAVVWTAVANALNDSGHHVEALTASRSALDLAGPDTLPSALDAAVTASRGLGRNAQAGAMLVQRAQLAPRKRTDNAEVKDALDAHKASSTASTAARLWVVSRTHPREVEIRAALLAALEADDARRPVLVMELVELAGDPDPERALAAVAALR
ncbi:MAG: hypothetical protein HOV81_21925 [Kofleriaceae bacterium]|nr:hypothetical protein [Kofleriaceae bacterium]